MSRMMHKPTSVKSKSRSLRERRTTLSEAMQDDLSASASNNMADDMSGDCEHCEDNGGFKTTGWIDQNVGTVSHFRCIYLAGLEVTYSGRKGYLTVHSRGEHRFNMPLGTLTQEEITQFAVSCAFQVLSEQYEVFKADVAKMGCTLEG